MNDNDTASDFELQLKQLQPVTCDKLMPDTFYRAGWQAAANSATHQTPAGTQRRQRVTTFVTGLACGLLVSVGMAAWQASLQHSAGPPVSPVVSRSPPVHRPSAPTFDQTESSAETEPSVNLQAPAAIASQAPDRWGDLVMGFSFWPRPGSLNSEPKAPAAVRPLSPAARHYWSSLVMTGPQSGLQTGQQTPPIQREDVSTESRKDLLPLRSFPATQRVLDELL
ncbi:MAG: hypothetical protein RIK87_05055 [Fuerstiella sp.]